MIRDEYNHVEVTNDKQSRGKEFGKTQKTEFSFQRENKNPETELNEKYVGKTVKKVTEVNVEYTNKVPTHGITVVKGATTASNVAATTSTVAVVASTVAVTAVAVATGISVALHDYKYDLSSFLITSKEISYALTITDNKADSSNQEYQQYNNQQSLRPRRLDDGEEETEYPFLLRVYNNYYDSTKNLVYGYNEGSFTDLTLGESYNIVLSENRYGGEVIFSETFTTYKNSVFRDFDISGDYDSAKHTFDVQMDFLDELERFNEFTLTLTDVENENLSFTYPLEAVSGVQKVDAYSTDVQTAGLDFSKTYNYQFSYKNNEDLIDFDSGTVSFFDTSDAVSKVYGATLDQGADFIKKEFYVTLDYRDDFNYFSQFEITLQDKEYPEEVTETFALAKDTNKQTIQITDDSSIYFRREYIYMITYQDSNTGMQEMIESGEIKFTDISGGQKVFNDIIIDTKPNFTDGTFGVTLDYVDDYDELVSFCITIFTSADDTRDIYLTETHEKQFIKASDYGINFTSTYQYNFKYYDVGIGEEVNFAQNRELSFDTSEVVSEFNDFIFDKTANYEDRSFVVQLDFQDDLKVFNNFQFTITDQDNGQTQDYYLEATTEPQTLTCNESSIDSDSGEETYRIDIVKDALSYTFRYFDTRINDFVTFANEEFRFQNSIESEFTGIETSYDFMAESSDQYLLPMRFIFDNKAHSYSGFRVVFEKDNVIAGDLAFEGETLTDNWLYGSYRGQEYDADEIINSEGVKIIVYAEQNTIDYPALESEIKVYEKEVRFTSGQVTDFYNATIANEYINMSSELGLYVVYQGNADNISAKLLLESYTGVTYTYNLMFDSLNYARVLLSEEDNGLTPSEDEFNDQFIDHTMKVSISYSIFTLDPTSTTGSDGSWSTYKTKVLYDSYQFSLSV